MTLFQWAGTAILTLVFLQAASAMMSGWRQRRYALREMNLRAQKMALQIEILTSHRRQQTLGWEGYRKFIVAKKVDACDDIVSIYLKSHDGLPIPDFKAGQHLTFRLQIPGQSKPGIRCYSLSDAPRDADQEHYRISVKQIPAPRDKPEAPPGLVSGFWHQGIAEMDLVDVRAPKGTFHLDDVSNHPVVLLAGGVGITPLLSMFRHLANRQSTRDVWLFYGVVNKHQVLNPEELQEAASHASNLHLRFAFSEPTEECELLKDYQRQGYVAVDWIREELGLPNQFTDIIEHHRPEFYICGPPPMMQSITSDLEAWSVPGDMIHFEAFGPASIKKRKTVSTETSGEPQAQFSVEFRRSGKTIDWQPDCGSLLETAKANDILLDCGCRCGDCGTCEIAVINGDVEYPEKEPQFDLQTGNCLTCIGVPKTNLVLDA